MGLLFVVRGVADFERFVAIAACMPGEDLVFISPDPTAVVGRGLHMQLFEGLGFRLLSAGELFSSSAPCTDLVAWLGRVNPDVVVFDQFGPSCPAAVVAIRDLVLELGVPTCMVPHGVRTVDRRVPPKGDAGLGRVADVIFYTSEDHALRAGCHLNAPGTRFAVLGDPRLDRTHLKRLLTLHQNSSEAGPAVGDGLGRVAYFGARCEADLLAALGRVWPVRDGNDLNRAMLDLLLTDGRNHVWGKPHPRLASWGQTHPALTWTDPHAESLALVSWADTVATPTSSVALEGLALGKPVVTLDIQTSAPEYRSIFEELPGESCEHRGPIELVCVSASEAFLNRYCWGGLGPSAVARSYAEVLRAVALGDRSGLSDASTLRR